MPMTVAWILAGAVLAAGPNAPTPPGAVAELADDVVVITTSPFAANSLLVRTADGTIVLVDTPTTPADTVALLDWTGAHWGAEPRYAINSHWHADATGGNQVLVGHGIEVISSARTARLVVERGEEMRESLVAMFAERDPSTAHTLEALRPTPAGRTYEIADRVTLELGGEQVQLVYPGPSHSPDSIAIYFPARRLLYGGCAVRSDGTAVNLNEADLANWPRALERLAALDPLVVVPGHGRRFDPAMIAESIDLVRGLADTPSP